MEDFEVAEKFLNPIRLGENLVENLERLNEFIRNDTKFRQQTPEVFYQVFHDTISSMVKKKNSEGNAIMVFENLLKCLRNSAAAFKPKLSENEKSICVLLIDHLDKNLNEYPNQTWTNNSLISHQIVELTLKYFFNISQGKNLENKEALLINFYLFGKIKNFFVRLHHFNEFAYFKY